MPEVVRKIDHGKDKGWREFVARDGVCGQEVPE